MIEELAKQRAYQDGLSELEVIEVLLQPKEIAAAYRRAADKMKEAGDYKNASVLVRKYQKKAKKAIRTGKEQQYQKAVEIMNTAESSVERKLAMDMLKRLKDYKDAEELYQVCKEQNNREMRLRDVQNVLAGIAIVLAVVAVYVLIA